MKDKFIEALDDGSIMLNRIVNVAVEALNLYHRNGTPSDGFDDFWSLEPKKLLDLLRIKYDDETLDDLGIAGEGTGFDEDTFGEYLSEAILHQEKGGWLIEAYRPADIVDRENKNNGQDPGGPFSWGHCRMEYVHVPALDLNAVNVILAAFR